jgi:activator of HSP90 ATPase
LTLQKCRTVVKSVEPNIDSQRSEARGNMPIMNANQSTRRQAISKMTMVLGGMVAGSEVLGQSQPSMTEEQRTQANLHRTFLHQEISLKASPERIYKTLLDSAQFAAFSGMPATIDPVKGGAFTMFGGMIIGLNVELLPNRRIVQAWRPTHWDEGIYSIVKFELKAHDSDALVVLDHTGFPEGEFDHLDSGWPIRYWNPLKKYLAKA